MTKDYGSMKQTLPLDRNSKEKEKFVDCVDHRKNRRSKMDRFVEEAKQELKSTLFWRAVFGEFLATVLYMIAAIGPGLTFSLTGTQPSYLYIAFGTGITVALLAHSFWDISGGHFNPVVSVALCVARKISFVRFVFYLIVQICGCLAGTGLLYAYTPAKHRGTLGVLSLNSEISLAQGFFMEITLTFIMVLVIISTTDPAKTNPGFLPPLAIGLSVTLDILIGIGFTGACMNPIRQLGPAVVMNKLKNLWLYWLAPMISGVITPLVYEFILTEKKCEDPKEGTNGTALTEAPKGTIE